MGSDIYDTQQKMVIMISALVPSLMMGIYIFGADVLLLTLVCAAAASASDWLAGKAVKALRGGAAKDNSRAGSLLSGAPAGDVRDLTAAVTGIILALSLPAGLPLWIGVIGSVIAVVVFKYIFGGIMDRTACPALAARLVLFFAFREQMTAWPLNDFVKTNYDEPGAVNGATPLTMLADGKEIPGLLRMFIGFVSGPCGAVSVAAILIGGMYLAWKKVISPKVPVLIAAVVFIIALVYYVGAGGNEGVMNGMGRSALYMAVFHLFTGGVLFSAFFCAPLCEEAVKSNTKLIVYTAGIGLITMAVRLWGPFEDGAALAVVVMNIVICVWALIARKPPSAHRKGADAEALKEK